MTSDLIQPDLVRAGWVGSRKMYGEASALYGGSIQNWHPVILYRASITVTGMILYTVCQSVSLNM